MSDAPKDRANQVIAIIADTFGETSEKANHAFDRYDQFFAMGGVAEKLAGTYLEWCLKHPARIGQMKHDTGCKCTMGWREMDDGHRPCPKCLPGAHDLWVNDFKSETTTDSDGML